MSKRRNPKKEKALRNQAYARKFRKRKTTGRFSSKKRYQPGANKSNDEDDNDNQWDDSSAQATGGQGGASRNNFQSPRRRTGYEAAEGAMA